MFHCFKIIILGIGLLPAQPTREDSPPGLLSNRNLPNEEVRFRESDATPYPENGPDTSTRALDPPFNLESEAAYTVGVGDQYDGEAVAGPGEYFVVWTDHRAGGWSGAFPNLYGQRIRPDGSAMAPGSIELLRDLTRQTAGIPTVGWNGSVYLVVWHEPGGGGRLLYGMRVAPDGQVLDPGGFLIGPGPGFGFIAWPAVASNGTDFLVVQARGGAIEGYRIGANGSVLDLAPLILSSGASGLGFPKLSYGAGVYLVAWAQAPPQMIRAARVTPAGQILDPGGVNVSGGGTDVDAFVTFDGQNFFVIWSRQDGTGWDVWGARVGSNGQLVSAPTLVLNGNPLALAFAGPTAFNGTHHIIALTTGEPVFSNTDLYALRVNTLGGAIGTPTPVMTVPGESEVAFGAASIADQYFISAERAWVRGVYYTYDVDGARINAAGTVLDTPPLAVSTCAAWQIASSLSFDGANFLCVFEDWREGKPDYQPDLYAVRTTPTGQPLDAGGILVASGIPGRPEQQPDAAFGGGQHVVVYEKKVGAVNEVRMARILPDRTVLDPQGILVFANEPTGETFRPKVAWNGQKYCVVWLDQLLYSGQQPLQFALVRVDGTIELGPVNVPNSFGTGVHNFEIGSDGNEFLIAWVDSDSVNATRVANSGGVIGTQTLHFTGNWITEVPQVAFNGSSYLVAWSQWGDGGVRVHARRVSQSGTPLGSVFTVIGPYPLAVPLEVLALGTDFAVVGYYRVASGDSAPLELFNARFDATGAPVGTPTGLMTLPWDDTYSSSSVAMTPGGTLMTMHSLWAGMPYNAPRLQGRLFSLNAPLPGDIDGDGDLDQADQGMFVTVLLVLDADPQHVQRSDVNGDGSANGGDIDTFVNVLLGP